MAGGKLICKIYLKLQQQQKLQHSKLEAIPAQIKVN